MATHTHIAAANPANATKSRWWCPARVGSIEGDAGGDRIDGLLSAGAKSDRNVLDVANARG